MTGRARIHLLAFVLLLARPCVGASDPARYDIEFTPPTGETISGATALVDGSGGGKAVRVAGQQYGARLAQPGLVDGKTTVTWSWKKTGGKICVIQFAIVDPETGASRYFGYGAGSMSESLSHDPTVEVFVKDAVPTQWTSVTRNLGADIERILGWKSARLTEVYLSPWDGDSGDFADGVVRGLVPPEARDSEKTRRVAELSKIGRGNYSAPPLRDRGEPRELVYDTHFEELAPGRNSASNEWSAFGWPGDQAFNAMGRQMRVRYPAFDLVFRLQDGVREIEPDSLDSFRLGLVRGDLPGVSGSWEYGGLRYSVSVLTCPSNDGSYDLYRVEARNPTKTALPSLLVAGLDGPPDMRLDDGIVRGLGGAPFAVANGTAGAALVTRDWGLCDKRAKSYTTGGGPGATEPAMATTRVGMDGLPVIYRAKVDPAKSYTVVLAASPHIAPILGAPTKAGDLVLRYQAEGASAQEIDWFNYVTEKPRPIGAAFVGAHDVDGDGYITLTAECSPTSRLKHTRLSAIYIFPSDVRIDDPGKVWDGSMNALCVQHIDVGATPECDWNNQSYDMSDVGLCRLNLGCGGMVGPGETQTCWLKVPPIHRREPVSMGNYSHAFLTVLPGEAVPPFDSGQLARLRDADPAKEWARMAGLWDGFYATMPSISTSDAVLGRMFRSRMAVRSILDVKIADKVWFNTCSPWFYYDFAYRDQAYVTYAYDLAGLHDKAARLLDVYCMDSKDVPLGPVSFGGVRLQLGMLPDGQWITRPGQFDTQGQNIWCLVQHYKLTGDRKWLVEKAYPYIRRGAQWLVNSRRKHMAEIGDPRDPRYGLIQPGAMEVGSVTSGMHMYYMDAWAILGLREAADAARALGQAVDVETFGNEASELKRSLANSMRRTFKREGLYSGRFWYGVEEKGDGMYGMWAHTPLVWPTRAVDPLDPMLTATLRKMERMADEWGGGMMSEGEGSCWPYIGVDWAIGYILRGEPEKTLDYFCALTDTAGLTCSWGEGYVNAENLASGDQPHSWADAQWVNLYRHLFVTEDGSTLLLTPASLRRWTTSSRGITLRRLPTEFGDLDLTIRGSTAGTVDYTFRLTPHGDQAKRPLTKIIVNTRTPAGRGIAAASVDGVRSDAVIGESVVIANPQRGHEYRLRLVLSPE